MILTVKIDDSKPDGRHLIQELRLYPQVVEFEFPVVADGVTPEGYKTSEEFRKSVKSKIHNYYKENGLL